MAKHDPRDTPEMLALFSRVLSAEMFNTCNRKRGGSRYAKGNRRWMKGRHPRRR